MEETQPKTGKFALTYGGILGGIGIVFSLMLYSMDMHYQGGMMVLGVSVLLTLAAIVVGLMQFKKANNGYMSFGQGMKVGVGICLIAGIIGLVFNQLMMNVIDPDMMTKAIEFQKGQLLQSSNMTPDQIDAQIEAQQKFMTPSMQIVFGLLYVIISGFILSLVPALILKKTEKS
ncbi:DUF4199 domain-containing protein [Maribacter algicola]|uniref:DUF4199 domain-containing protein n=1 Tax=Meishania litoralis TaxID=3434685 RepID=A0ACC7LP93_9FLAO